jgi:hypothetical protein
MQATFFLSMIEMLSPDSSSWLTSIGRVLGVNSHVLTCSDFLRYSFGKLRDAAVAKSLSA